MDAAMDRILAMKLGDDTMAALAHANPTLVQLHLLTTPGVVQSFLRRARGGGDEEQAPGDHRPMRRLSPIERLYTRSLPLVPVFRQLSEDPPNFRMECRLGELVCSAVASSKRIAKQTVAQLLLDALIPDSGGS